MPQKRITTAYILVLLSVSAVLLPAMMLSCAREGSLQNGITSGPSGELTLLPVGSKNTDGTRAVSEGGLMPDEYTIYLSACVTDCESPENEGDYIVGVPFTKFGYDASGDASGDDAYFWHSSPRTYWPIDGKVNLLAVATDASANDLSREGCMVWRTPCTDGVDITFTAEHPIDAASELLYSDYIPAAEHDRSASAPFRQSVAMPFHHSQCLLEFSVTTDLVDLVRVDHIIVKNAATYGMLSVMTQPSLSAAWDLTDVAPADAPIPGSLQTVSSVPVLYHGSLIPQPRQTIIVYFRQRANYERDWDTEYAMIPFKIEPEGPEERWEAGYRYIYNISVSSHTIKVVPTITDWTDGTTETLTPEQIQE